MRLQGKSAVIYGANSPTGASVAQAFAREGASIYLAGRSPEEIQPVAQDIVDSGGNAEVARVDPLDPTSVSEHLHRVVVQHGSVDISLNLAFREIEAPTRLCNLTGEQFAAATFTRVLSNFVTTAAASSEMAFQGRGTILASAGRDRSTSSARFAGEAIGNAAIEALCHQLRLDVGPYGVRVGYLPETYGADEDLIDEVLRVLESGPTASPPAGASAVSSAFAPRPNRAELSTGALTG